MNSIIFYKLKIFESSWHILFLNSNGEYKYIKNNCEDLRNYLELNKETIFIGANNSRSDDIILTSLIKNNSLAASNIVEEDKEKYLPIILDITQGIVRNTLIDFNVITCSQWNGNMPLVNYYAIDETEIKRELFLDVELIKNLYNIEERRKFLNWKINVVSDYNLPKKAYTASFGRLMQYIIGLNIDNSVEDKKFTLDANLDIELKKMNDPFLNDLLSNLKEMYLKGTDDKIVIDIQNCRVKFNKQGIYGSIQNDLVDTDSNNLYLYIDFNSFGPSILINNEWLKDVSRFPDRYKEIRDIRIDLKGKKQLEQLFYKNILNAGLDDLNEVYTSNNENIGVSLSMSGIMTMMLLYRKIEKYGIDLIECNTDGIIVKCSKEVVNSIKEEVKQLEDKLSLSCDVDVVNKIVHFDEKNYMMEFDNGKIKHIGVFGAFQDNPLNCTGIIAVDEALRNYYLYDVPVSVTLRNIRNNNDLKAFQIVRKWRSNEKSKYLKVDDKYILCPCKVNRLFAIKEDKMENALYINGSKGNMEIYKEKRGRSVKEGYFYFELSDRGVPNIYDLDLTYYINKCYKVIKAHPKRTNIYLNYNNDNKVAFIDLDGTLIKDKDEHLMHEIFVNASDGLVNQNDIENKYNLFCQRQGNYLLQFLGICKKYKGYGTVENFAQFLMDKQLFSNSNIQNYKAFVNKLLQLEKDLSYLIESNANSKQLLEYLKGEGYKLLLYSNWFKIVQEEKLETHELLNYFDNLCTIDEYYAKSSVTGWNDLLKSNNIDEKCLKVMIGNSSSDIVPKRLNIPSFILTSKDKSISSSVLNNGNIISSLDEIQYPYFTSEILKMGNMANNKTKKR